MSTEQEPLPDEALLFKVETALGWHLIEATGVPEWRWFREGGRWRAGLTMAYRDVLPQFTFATGIPVVSLGKALPLTPSAREWKRNAPPRGKRPEIWT